MIVSRRILLGMAAAISSATYTSAKSADVRNRPDPASFQSGDLIWPKKKGAIVPYATGIAGNQAVVWVAERRRSVKRMRCPLRRSLSRRFSILEEVDHIQLMMTVDPPSEHHQ